MRALRMLPQESLLVARDQSALITKRLPAFAIGWLGAMAMWIGVFATEGRLTRLVVALAGLGGVALAAAVRLCRANPQAPRVVPVVAATCVLLGLITIALVDASGAYGEILAFMLLTLYLAAALSFSWGWRAELVLLAATLVPWALVLHHFELFVPLPELAAAVTIGSSLALAIAEGSARNFRNVMRRRRAQQAATHALQMSRDAYRDLAESARDMIWAADPDGRLTYVNETVERFVGVPAGDLLGRRIVDFYTTHPENPRFEEVVAQLRAGAVLPPLLVECRTPRGPRWAEAVCSAILDARGAIVGIRGISRDVQERRDAEARLRESEERFRTAFDHAAIGMLVVAIDGRAIQVNRAFAEMLGYLPAEIEGRTMDAFAHRDDVARALSEAMRLVAGTVRAFQMEKRYLHKDGHEVWCLLSCSLTRDAAGLPLHLIAQVQDISERKAAEEALRASESRYRGLVESQQELIVRLNAAGEFTFVNDAYAALFAQSPRELLGRVFFDLVHPDDRGVLSAAIAALAQPPHRVLIEIRNLTAEGPRWISWEGGIVLDDGGHMLEAQAVGRDVTERRAAEDALRESEARFRSAFEDAAIGMGVTLLDGRTIRVNRALCDMLGYGEDELLGVAPRDIVHPDDQPQQLADQARLLAGEVQSYRAERRYLRRDGRVVWVHATVSMVRDGNGEPLYMIGQIQDFTERRLAEEALRASLAELRRSEEKLRLLARRQVAIREQERKRLGFDLHDDVCQELVGVGILVESLRRKLAPMPAEQSAEFHRVVRYLNEVVEHLRLLARELRPLLLHDLGLDGGLGSLCEGMSSPTVRVVMERYGVVPRLHEEVEVTVYRIAQEALANAARHAHAARIVVSLGVTDGMLHLAIRDDGCGFDPSARPASALGLASMEERALALGGRLEVVSAPGKGTTVTLTCPLAVRPAAVVTGTGDRSPTRSSSRPSKGTTPRSAARD
jgi:PAS domain S-box-containing protein